MSEIFESIRWGSVLLTVLVIGLVGLVHRMFLVPLERRHDLESKRAALLQSHLQSARAIEALASDFLISYAGNVATSDELSSIITHIESQIALVQDEPEVLRAQEYFILIAQDLMATRSLHGSNPPSPTQLARLEDAFVRLSSRNLQVTERLAT